MKDLLSLALRGGGRGTSAGCVSVVALMVVSFSCRNSMLHTDVLAGMISSWVLQFLIMMIATLSLTVAMASGTKSLSSTGDSRLETTALPSAKGPLILILMARPHMGGTRYVCNDTALTGMSLIFENLRVRGLSTMFIFRITSMPRMALNDSSGDTNASTVVSSLRSLMGSCFARPKRSTGFLLAPVTLKGASLRCGLGSMRLYRSSDITVMPAPVSNSHLS